MSLISLNLGQPEMRAGGYESNAPTGVSLSDMQGMEQFLIGLGTHSGQVVTPEKAKRCSAVLAILRGLSEDISALPLPLYKRGPNGDERAADHPVDRVLNVAPNDLMTPMELREHIFYDMVLHGGFFVLKNEDPQNPGQLASLWPLAAGYVTRIWRQAVWTFTDPVTGVSGEFTPDTVWRGTIMSPNGIDGVALTLLAREAIGLLLAAEEQGARLFSYGVQSDLVLKTADDASLDEPTKNQLRQAFMERHSGSRNSFMPLLLEGGLDAKRIGLTAQESQYIEARAFQIGDIARIFRYPDVLLGSMGKSSKSSTYASAEQFFESYTKHTLRPWAVRIEQTIHRDLLTTKEQAKYFVKHDFSQLLRADTAGRYATYATGIASGFLSPGEVRREENKPFVPGLDYYTRPLNTEATAGGDAASVKPTDVSGRLAKTLYFPNDDANEEPADLDLRLRVATAILKKERKALAGDKADAEFFYSRFGGYVSDLTGASPERAQAYLDTRCSDPNRFSPEAQDAATAHLISLCTKEQ